MKSDLIPVVIQDTNRNKYLAGLKEYRETQKIATLLELFEKEQKVYVDKITYFLGCDN